MFLISFRLLNKLVLIKSKIRHNIFQMYSYKNNFKKICISHKHLIIILRNDLDEDFLFYLLIEIGDFLFIILKTVDKYIINKCVNHNSLYCVKVTAIDLNLSQTHD